MSHIEKSKEELLLELQELKIENESLKQARLEDNTLHKITETNLRNVGLQFKSVIESTSDIIAVMDGEYRYSLFNSAFHKEFKKIFGKDINIGDSMPEALKDLPNDLDFAMKYWTLALAGEDITITRQFGELNLERNWYELHFTPIKDDEGKVVSALHIVRNVTERKLTLDALQAKNEDYESINEELRSTTEELQATTEELRLHNEELRQSEESTKKSEERYRSLLGNLEAGIVVHASDTSIISNNPKASELLGLSDDQMKGKVAIDPAWKFINEDKTTLPIDEYPVNRVLKIKTSFRNQVLGINHPCKKDIVWVMANGLPMMNNTGDITEILISFIDITERKKAEELMRESDQKFSLFMDYLPAIVFLKDNEGRTLFVNKFMDDALGASKWIGKTMLEVFPNEFGEKLVADDMKTIKSGYQKIEENIPHIDGKMHNYETQKFIIPRVGQKPLLGGVALDITERKLAEDALRESEEKFRNLFNNSEVGMFRTRLDGSEILEFNEKYLKILGRTMEEMMGNPSRNLWADKHERDEMVKRLVADGFVNELECKILNKQGEIRICVTSLKLYRETGILEGSIQDITERKRAENALKESEEKFSALFASMTEMVVLHELVFNELGEAINYRIIDCNNAFTEVTGIKKEDAVGKLATEVYRTEHAPYLEVYSKVAISGINYEYTTYFQPMDKYFAISVVAPKKNMFSTVTTDITVSKKAEDEILRLNEELEQRVIERTIQLEESYKELESFSYSVSHDLRAPLRHISGFSDLLKNKFQDLLPEQGRHYINTIVDSVRRMGTLIDDLLMFSRMGKAEIQNSMLDTNQIVKDIVEFLIKENSDRKINWDISDLPPIYGDSSMLKLVWINLISNAIKFTGTREFANIIIGANEEKNEIIFFIKDNGVGFDMKYYDKLFNVFQRLHSNEEFEGTGIGLANVRRIILRHFGRIFAEAEIENGATFYFALPKLKEKK